MPAQGCRLPIGVFTAGAGWVRSWAAVPLDTLSFGPSNITVFPGGQGQPRFPRLPFSSRCLLLPPVTSGGQGWCLRPEQRRCVPRVSGKPLEKPSSSPEEATVTSVEQSILVCVACDSDFHVVVHAG